MIIRINNSISITAFVIVLHTSSALILWQLPLPLLARIAGTCGLLVSGIWYVGCYGTRQSRLSIRSVRCGQGKPSQIQISNLPEWLDIEWITFVDWHWLVLAKVKPATKPKPVNLVVSRDAVDPSCYHQFRVWLRLSDMGTTG
ncbi:MAG: hypothetical protein OEY67_01110 [Gammaproteobacteria bacterium]|nr:hypothetical protein [Gammaproteobacteria bacterium]